MCERFGQGLDPELVPSAPTRRTSRARMRSLIRGSLVSVQRLCGITPCRGRRLRPRTRNDDGRRREATSASRRPSRDPGAHRRRTLRWPGGDPSCDPASLVQLCGVGYQHEHALDTRRRAPRRPAAPPGARAGAGASDPEPTPGRPAARAEPTDGDARPDGGAATSSWRGTPAALVVANHAIGLFELAAVPPVGAAAPTWARRRLAIDALARAGRRPGPARRGRADAARRAGAAAAGLRPDRRRRRSVAAEPATGAALTRRPPSGRGARRRPRTPPRCRPRSSGCRRRSAVQWNG